MHAGLGRLIPMPGTSARIDPQTPEDSKPLATVVGTRLGGAVAIAARRLRHEQIRWRLSTPLGHDEIDWSDAELG